jgi:hypothetical protein
LINTRAVWAETRLFLSESMVDMFLDPIKQYPSKDFAWYRFHTNSLEKIKTNFVTKIFLRKILTVKR